MSHSSKSADGTAEVCPTRMRSDEITAHKRRKISKHCYLCRKADINNKLVGDTPSNANNLSVIGIYPAKKSNRNQKNNAQKESIGLCKKRIDKMEMPTKSK